MNSLKCQSMDVELFWKYSISVVRSLLTDLLFLSDTILSSLIGAEAHPFQSHFTFIDANFSTLSR